MAECDMSECGYVHEVGRVRAQTRQLEKDLAEAQKTIAALKEVLAANAIGSRSVIAELDTATERLAREYERLANKRSRTLARVVSLRRRVRGYQVALGQMAQEVRRKATWKKAAKKYYELWKRSSYRAAVLDEAILMAYRARRGIEDVED